MKKIRNIIDVLKKHKSFCITTHTHPDPDAICSELAMAQYLLSLKKKVHIVNEERIPTRFSFLPGSKDIRAYQSNLKIQFDVMIILDCGDLNRIGEVQKLIGKNHLLLNIDHHITNDSFGNYNLINPEASSTAEVLYNLFKEAKFNPDDIVAMHLYAGIMTDTGSFRYENTKASTHKIAGELKKRNFSPAELYKNFYETLPLKEIKEFIHILSEFKSLNKDRVIIVELTKEKISRFSEEFDLRDTIFKFLRAIKGVEVLAILTEIGTNETRVNFRSAGQVDVAKIAQHFKGGGHIRASGCLIKTNINKAYPLVVKEINKVL